MVLQPIDDYQGFIDLYEEDKGATDGTFAHPHGDRIWLANVVLTLFILPCMHVDVKELISLQMYSEKLPN